MPFETENKNFQSQLNFSLAIHKLPHVNFNLTRVVLPGVEIMPVTMPTPLNAAHFAGDEIRYGQLEMDFKVQEGMRDWFEVFQWIVSMGFPDTFERYADIRRGRLKNLDGKTVKGQDSNPARKLQNLFSDVTLLIHTSKDNPYLEATFKDAFPVYVSPLSFNTTDEDVKYLTATARFQYDTYDFKKP